MHQVSGSPPPSNQSNVSSLKPKPNGFDVSPDFKSATKIVTTDGVSYKLTIVIPIPHSKENAEASLNRFNEATTGTMAKIALKMGLGVEEGRRPPNSEERKQVTAVQFSRGNDGEFKAIKKFGDQASAEKSASYYQSKSESSSGEDPTNRYSEKEALFNELNANYAGTTPTRTERPNSETGRENAPNPPASSSGPETRVDNFFRDRRAGSSPPPNVPSGQVPQSISHPQIIFERVPNPNPTPTTSQQPEKPIQNEPQANLQAASRNPFRNRQPMPPPPSASASTTPPPPPLESASDLPPPPPTTLSHPPMPDTPTPALPPAPQSQSSSPPPLPTTPPPSLETPLPQATAKPLPTPPPHSEAPTGQPAVAADPQPPPTAPEPPPAPPASPSKPMAKGSPPPPPGPMPQPKGAGAPPPPVAKPRATSVNVESQNPPTGSQEQLAAALAGMRFAVSPDIDFDDIKDLHEEKLREKLDNIGNPEILEDIVNNSALSADQKTIIQEYVTRYENEW